MTTDEYNFGKQLQLSHEFQDKEWWIDLYKNYFDDYLDCKDLRKHGWWQKAGIDRVVITESSNIYKIDEKVDTYETGNIFLEFNNIYDDGKEIKGWAAKNMACDYIAYAFIENQECFLLPHNILIKMWNNHKKQLKNKYGIVEVDNKSWITLGTPVPKEKVLEGLKYALKENFNNKIKG